MRRIFVGSSTESLDKAKIVCHMLSSFKDTKGVLWTEFFEPGLFTFEALERMLRQCCAAVFIATPDDEAEVRGKTIHCPRSNVLLEFGLVAGRLGPHCVAVCRYGGAELPSDLTGLTTVEMDSDDAEVKSPISKNAKDTLRIWSSRLSATCEAIARTDIVHGYSGRWKFDLRLDKWRDLAIEFPSYAQVNGVYDLYIPSSGRIGIGLAHARLSFKLYGHEPAEKESFQGDFYTAHEITNAVCYEDEHLEFASQAFGMQKINCWGQPPQQLEGLDVAPEPWSSQWSLSPNSELRTLEGTVTTEGTGISHGHVKATKLDIAV